MIELVDHSASVDPVSGYVVVNGRDHCIVWNYRNPAVPPSQLEIPLKSIQGDRLMSCLIPGTQSSGLIGVNQEGLLRLWETVGLPDQFRELELSLDSDPLFMIPFEVSHPVKCPVRTILTL
jgi:hypothetical protein